MKASKTAKQERNPIYNLRRELIIREFSKATVKSCLHYNIDLFNFITKSPRSINCDDIKEHLLHLKNNGAANATLNVTINIIKFYYTRILKRKFFVNKNIARIKKEAKIWVG